MLPQMLCCALAGLFLSDAAAENFPKTAASTCFVTTTADTGPGSLREAILCANANPGPDTIRFQIPGAGPHLIALQSALPAITNAGTMLDATTQPGWSLGHVIVDGAATTAAKGLHILADNTTVRGLFLRDFETGILAFQCSNVALGDAGKGNAIGGARAQHGIAADRISGIAVRGNVIGLAPDGSSDNSPIMCCGILLNNALGGGAMLAEKNHLGGMANDGITFIGNNGTARQNRIGTDATGLLPFPCENAINANLGANFLFEDNDIAFCSKEGLYLGNVLAGRISKNRFWCNAYPITVEASNGGIQAPLIAAANLLGASGTAAPGATVEVFKHDPTACAGAVCQGRVFVGTATADNAGNWSLAASFSANDLLTAIATGAQGSSESSGCKSVADCSAFAATAFAFAQICAAAPDGMASVVAFGSAPPYQYLWNTGATDPNLKNLVAGTYAVTITAANGCTATASTSVSDGTFEGIWTLHATTSPTCANSADGTAHLSPMSGTPPYQIAWSNGATGEDATGLAAGIYQVSASDANGCHYEGNVVIVAPPPIVFSLAQTLCPGAALAVGSQVFDQNSPSGQAILPNAAANGCDSMVNVSLSFWPTMSVSASQQTPVSAPGATDGQASGNIAGSAAPFSLAWSGPASGSQTGLQTGQFFIQNLPAGNYSATVADAHGCSQAASFAISDCAVSAALSAQDVSCFGLFDGQITLAVSGGSSPIFKWSNGATSQNLADLPAGNYAVTITDAGGAGCSATFSATVGQPPALALSNVSENCQPDDLAYAVQFSVSGGTPAYALASGAGALAGGQFSSALIPSGQAYLFEIADANGCKIAQSGLKNCGCAPAPTASAFALATAACAGGSISLGENGAGGVAWNWSGPGGWLATQRNPIRSFVALGDAGAYTVVVTGANGCTASSTVLVEVLPSAGSSLTAKICRGEAYFFGTDTLRPAALGTSIFTQKFAAANGCDSTVTLLLTVVERQALAAEADDSGLRLAPGATELLLPVLENDALPADGLWSLSISQSPASGAAAADSAGNVLFTLQNAAFFGADTLWYRLCSATCPSSCDSAWARFFVQNDDLGVLQDAIANVLTPGEQDGKNDVFRPVENLREAGFEVDENAASLSIFNRWGELVHAADQPPFEWRGTDAAGRIVPQATYYFVLNSGIAGRAFKGTVTVLR